MQEIKNKIRVAAAALAGGLMLGATMAGAFAANLGDLPAPFVVNNNMAGQIVVGASATVPDVIAAAQISAALGQYMVSASSSGSTASSTTAFTDDYSIAATDIEKKLTAATYSDLLSFSEVSFTGADSDSHTVQFAETVEVDGVSVEKGASFSTSSDYYSTTADLFLKIESGDTLKYYLDFKNTEINNNTISTDKSIRVEFLGDILEITKIETNKITVRTGSKFTVKEHETITWDGTTVNVGSVYDAGSSAYGAIFEIGGISVSIDAGSKDKIGDIEINVAKIRTPWDASAGTPTIEFYVGAETGKAYTNGDEYLGEDSSHPAWKWSIVTGTSGSDLYLDTLGVDATSKQSLTTSYDEQKPISEGNSLVFPGSSGIALSLVGHTVTDTVNYNVEASSLDVLVTSGRSIGINDGSNYVDKLTFRFNESGATNLEKVYIGYIDPVTDDLTWTQSTAVGGATAGAEVTNWINWWFTVGDDENSVRLGLTSINKTVTTSAYDALVFNISYTTGITTSQELATINITKAAENVALGDNDDDDSGELVFGSAIGSAKYDIRSNYGIVFKAGDGSESVQMVIPKSQDKITVLLGKEGTAVAAGGVTYTYTGLTSEIAVLDTEANEAIPMIIVGGPYANTMASALLGSDDAEIEEFFGFDATSMTGKGIIMLYDSSESTLGVDALLVAGWTSDDTRAAAYTLSKYLSGSSSLSSLSGKTKITVTATGATTISNEEVE